MEGFISKPALEKVPTDPFIGYKVSGARDGVFVMASTLGPTRVGKSDVEYRMLERYAWCGAAGQGLGLQRQPAEHAVRGRM